MEPRRSLVFGGPRKESRVASGTGENAIGRWASFSAERLATIGGVELSILKSHLILEDVLKFVLAKRLGLSDDAFFDLRVEFPTLLRVAMAGVDKPHLVGALRALNSARNHVSHRVESAEVSHEMGVSCRKSDASCGNRWPGLKTQTSSSQPYREHQEKRRWNCLGSHSASSGRGRRTRFSGRRLARRSAAACYPGYPDLFISPTRAAEGCVMQICTGRKGPRQSRRRRRQSAPDGQRTGTGTATCT